ncbi:MAG: response regulator [Bacteroidetes bacterium]|nr:response regulator [Bacteroidota bacterium]
MLLLAGACHEAWRADKAAVKGERKSSLILLTEDGDTIPTGVPYLLEGDTVRADTLPPPYVFSPEFEKIQLPKPNFQQPELVWAKSWSQNVVQSIQGGSGAPLPQQRVILPDTFDLPVPRVVTALPWRFTDITSSRFRVLDTGEGMDNSFVHAVFEDSKGRIWIGTNKGFSLYDGKYFWHYKMTDITLNAPISGFAEDRDGNLWMTHGVGGSVTKYDGKQLYYYAITYRGFGKKSDTLINRINIDKGNTVWICSQVGVGSLKNDIYSFYGRAQFDSEYDFSSSFVDSTGNIWIGNDQGLYKYDGQNIQSFYFPTYPEIGLDSTHIHLTNAGNQLWFSKGRQILKLANDSVYLYKVDFYNGQTPMYMAAGEDESLWIGYAGAGLSQFDGEVIRHFTPEEGLPKISLFPEMQDREGRLYLGSERGMHQFSPKGFRHYYPEYFSSEFMIAAIEKDEENRLWLGSIGENGLMLMENENLYGLKGTNELKAVGFRSLHASAKGGMWIGSRNGVYKFENQQLTWFNKASGIPGQITFAIEEDQDQNMWFGFNEGGVSKFDGKSFIHYKLKEDKKVLDPLNYIRVIKSDQKGNTWMGTHGSGLRKFDGKYTTFYTRQEGLNSDTIVSILEDSRGLLWIGTVGGGVNVYDGKKFHSISAKEGLTSNDIWTISEDESSRIWLGVTDCLNVIELKSERFPSIEYQLKDQVQINTYCDLDGLKIYEFFAGAGKKESNGGFWWGHNKGLSYLPVPDRVNTKPPDVELMNLSLNQENLVFRDLKRNKAHPKSRNPNDIDPGKIRFSGVHSFQNVPRALVLPHDINNLSFHLSSRNYPRQESVRFSCFLEGVDQGWTMPDFLSKYDYRGIPPGKYTFRAKATGDENIWGEEMVYQFTIRPPWWKSKLALVLWTGLFIGLVWLIYRFNLRKQLEKEDTLRRLELEEMKSRLYTNITHEFRTPLTVILGMTNQLIDTSKQETQKTQLGLIKRNSRKLLRMINQLLDLSKLDSGKFKLDLIQGDIVGYLRYLTESFHSMAQEKNLQLTFQTEEKEIIMDYDEDKVQHIIYNLLFNAIKFTPPEGKVLLNIRKEEKEKKSILRVKVSDTGIGIAASDLPHIFDQFFQVDNSTTRKGEGTGIGLALTKELVELMDGQIEVQSEIDKGSVFEFFLPINQEAELTERKHDEKSPFLKLDFPAALEMNENPAADKSDFPVLLIIEDNKDVVYYIKSILEDFYQIFSAENGRIGVEKAAELVPDIIISDVMMPEMDGLEVCNTLKADFRTSHIPIVLLTARAQIDDRIEGLRFGADAYLTKPFNKEELLVQVKTLLEAKARLQKYFSTIVQEDEFEPKSDDKESQFIQDLRELVKGRIDDADLKIPELAEALFMSQIQVYRKLKALTGQTPSQFIRSIRLHEGRRLLQSSGMTVSEVAYSVGFSDPNYFSRMFREKYGVAPSDVRN